MPPASTLGLIADLLDPPFDPYRTDPVTWVNERLGEFLWSGQKEIAQSLVNNRQTAVQSCHGIGKSFLAARLICWWLETHKFDSTFVVSTAPTHDQVKGVLWNEIGRAHRSGSLWGRVNMTEWLVGNELIGFGRSPKNAHSFQGHHATYLLVVLDEACGIPFEIWDSANSLASNDTSRILAVGNPTDPGAHFAEVCKPGSGWNVIKVGAFETPNFTDEPVPADVKRNLIGPNYVESQRNPVNGGEGSPMWFARILGEFPLDSDDGVVRYSKVAECARQGQEHTPDDLLPVELGVDVGASAGGDQSVIVLRTGKLAQMVVRKNTPEVMELVGLVLNAIKMFNPTSVKVDHTGVGAGVTSRLRELRNQGDHNAQIVGVMTGAGSSDPKQFPRLRSQIWWEVGRELSETGGWDLSELPDSTINQLCAPKYTLDSSNRICVEPKDDTRARLRRSPDEADALLLAFYRGGSIVSRFFEDMRADKEREAADVMHHASTGLGAFLASK